MPTSTLSGGYRAGLAATYRTDRWWVEPLWTGVGFLLFVIYATWAAFQGNYYFYGGYLSPFYSPVLFTDPTRARRGAGRARLVRRVAGLAAQHLAAVPPALAGLADPRRPARLPLHLLLLPQGVLPLVLRRLAAGLRGRRRSPQRNYRGETALLLFQNLHRYALYIALAVHRRSSSYDALICVLARRPVRHRRRHASSSAINVVLLAQLHVRLPLVPPPDRRPARLHVTCDKPRANALRRLAARRRGSTSATCSSPGSA